MKVVRLPIYITALAVLCPTMAKASPDTSQVALANQLFDDAEKLMGTSRATEACPKYAESQRLDPQLGTLLHLGACYVKVGKTASAWASFKDAADLAARKHDEREAVARQYLAVLELQLSRLSIEVAMDAPPSIEVKRDGEPFGRAAWGSPMPIDPGPHVITASCNGYKDWQTTIDVPAAASVARVSVPRLEPFVVQPAPPPTNPGPTPPISNAVLPVPPASAAQAGPASTPAPVVDRTSSNSTQKILAGVSLAIGGAGLAVGAVSGAMVLSKRSTLDNSGACVNRVCASSQHDTLSSYKSLRTVSTVGFIVGGLATATGVTLLLTVPKSEGAAISAWVGPASAGLRGTF